MKLYSIIARFYFLLAILICIISVDAAAQYITTFAGDGVRSHSGDGGLATAAGIYWPVHTAMDGAGNIYFTDYSNSCVRKINSSGIITNYAGNGIAGYSGDGIAATLASVNSPTGIAADASGNVFIADWLNHRV